MIKISTKQFIHCRDWDKLVQETYGRPYCFQQQDGCKDRGIVHITVPVKYPKNYENSKVPEIVNHFKMGVSFKSWLERDPEQLLTGKDDQDEFSLGLWWDRNFYPNIDMVVNDLYAKGLIEKGEYIINID
jgi:hypothetical protein